MYICCIYLYKSPVICFLVVMVNSLGKNACVIDTQFKRGKESWQLVSDNTACAFDVSIEVTTPDMDDPVSNPPGHT